MGYFRGGVCWKTTADKQRQIADLYRQGHPAKDIAQRFSIDSSYVSVIARRHGCTMRGSGHATRLHRRVMARKSYS